ncbi:MAG: DUF2834 domain-containing protein [Cyanobacteria bacterium SBLK]|nr:DUF2834 domain-containing protein [Cyanobacteria bacterium SBLK]
MKIFYLLLTILGAIVPWGLLVGFFAENGLDNGLFLQQMFANEVATAIATDLIISAIVFLCFAFVEMRRSQISLWWMLLVIALTFGVGLSCGLPFFLCLREWQLEKQTISE